MVFLTDAENILGTEENQSWVLMAGDIVDQSPKAQGKGKRNV